jgi:hypothetical protein
MIRLVVAYSFGSRRDPRVDRFPANPVLRFPEFSLGDRWAERGSISYGLHDSRRPGPAVGSVTFSPLSGDGSSWLVEDRLNHEHILRPELTQFALLVAGPRIAFSAGIVQELRRQGPMDAITQRLARRAGWYPEYDKGSSEVVGFASSPLFADLRRGPQPWTVDLMLAVLSDPGRVVEQAAHFETIARSRQPSIDPLIIQQASTDAILGACRRAAYSSLLVVSGNISQVYGSDLFEISNAVEQLVVRLGVEHIRDRRYEPVFSLLSRRSDGLDFQEHLKLRIGDDIRSIVGALDREIDTHLRRSAIQVSTGEVATADVQSWLLRDDLSPPADRTSMSDDLMTPPMATEALIFRNYWHLLTSADADPRGNVAAEWSTRKLLRSVVALTAGRSLVSMPTRWSAKGVDLFTTLTNLRPSIEQMPSFKLSGPLYSMKSAKGFRAYWRQQMYPNDVGAEGFRRGFGRININDGRQLWVGGTVHTMNHLHPVHDGYERLLEGVLHDPARNPHRELAVLLEAGGGDEILYLPIEDAVRHAAEFARIRRWAVANNVRTEFPEPSLEKQMNHMWKECGARSRVPLVGRLVLQYLEGRDLNCLEYPSDLDDLKAYIDIRAQRLPAALRNEYTYDKFVWQAAQEFKVPFDPTDLHHITMLWQCCNWQTESALGESPDMAKLRHFRDDFIIPQVPEIFETHDVVMFWGHPHNVPFEAAFTAKYSGPDWETVVLSPHREGGRFGIRVSGIDEVKRLDAAAIQPFAASRGVDMPGLPPL